MRERGGRRRGRVQTATLRVCVTCRWKGLCSMADAAVRPGRRLHDLVREEAGPEHVAHIQEIVCLTHCTNACNAVAMQRGKPPLLLTRMAPDRDTARAALDVLRRFGESESGEVSGTSVETCPLVPPDSARTRR